MKKPDKYQNKYRISSARLINWDYGSPGAYFITICTRNRKPYFGDVINGKMKLSEIGIIADIFWYEIKNHTKNISNYIINNPANWKKDKFNTTKQSKDK